MLLGNAVFAISGQLLSSASNYIFPLIAFAYLSTQQFGFFTVIYGLLQFLFGLHRSLVCENKLIVRKNNIHNNRHGFNLGPSLLFSLIVCMIFLSVGIASDATEIRAYMLVVAMPAVLFVNDYYRYTNIQNGKYKNVFCAELIWLLTGSILIVMHIVSLGELDGVALLSYWVAGSFIGVIFYAIVNLVDINLSYKFTIATDKILAEINWSFFLENLISRGGNILGLYLLSILLSLEEVGRLQGAIQIFSPVLVLLAFWQLLGLKYLAGIASAGNGPVLKVSDIALITMSLLLAIWWLLIGVVSSKYGGNLFRSGGWGLDNLPLIALYCCAVSTRMIYVVSFKALDMGKELLPSQSLFSIVKLAAGLLFAATYGIHSLLMVWTFITIVYGVYLRRLLVNKCSELNMVRGG